MKKCLFSLSSLPSLPPLPPSPPSLPSLPSLPPSPFLPPLPPSLPPSLQDMAGITLLSELVGLTGGTVVPAGALLSPLSLQLPQRQGPASSSEDGAASLVHPASPTERGHECVTETDVIIGTVETMPCTSEPNLGLTVNGQSPESVSESRSCMPRPSGPASPQPSSCPPPRTRPKPRQPPVEFLASLSLPPASHLQHYLAKVDSSLLGVATPSPDPVLASLRGVTDPSPSPDPVLGDNGLFWMATSSESCIS